MTYQPIIGAHGVARAWERYRIELTPQDARQILDDCISGKAPMMHRDARHAGVTHICNFHGMLVNVVIGRNPDRIITFPPPDHFTKGANFERHMLRKERRKKLRREHV